MSRRGKLQEFAAHGVGVNCIHIGRKSGQVMVTGGEDRKVNMWAVGKPNAIMSLAGHTSPVECVSFDTAEEVVVAGSASGTIKLWDLEQAKVVRTLTGHRSNTISVDFHPYGEFFASGSQDTNLKVWDIRRKGCIQTYKGHQSGIGVIRFSPDGRWVVSGDESGAVKLWDLTAGKQLTEFTSHKARVSDIAFHPNEFLLSTASEDRSLKFWDLETFDLVSNLSDSTRTRRMAYAKEGQVLVSASDQYMKVVGWEPPTCHDALDVGWSKIHDMHVVNGDQLIATGLEATFVSVWVVNLQQCKPWGAGITHARAGLTAEPSPRASAPTHVPEPSRGKPSSKSSAAGSSKLPWNVDDDPSSAAGSASGAGGANGGAAHAKSNLTRPSDPDLSATGRHVSVGVGDSISRNEYHSTPPRTKKWSKEKDAGFSPAVQAKEPKAKEAPSAAAGKSAAAAPAAAGERERAGPRNIIPSSRHEPVGLDVESFLPQTRRTDSGSVASMSDAEIMASISKSSSTLATVLQTRLTNIRAIRAFWANGDLKGALEHMIKLNDPAIAVDVLSVLSQKSTLFTLDIAVLVFPVLIELLRSQYEEYVKLSLEVLNMLCKSFGALIEQTRVGPKPAGNNLVYEERVEKCKVAFSYFREARQDAQALVTAKALGPSARLFITTADSYLTGLA
eukprot:TRINITY_DN2218_c0_g1_i4.p1 TRINITY_DN2218_c0_g1~~TRINITY_DN2218_c0_g1_i4.p1  ORF type:complete len:674 (+),score=128.51 TRINITY_DN2218_c0_g1_i4:2-2023(+)